MTYLKPPPQADALFGVFLQDVRKIRERHPRTFKKHYYRFEYAAIDENGYGLYIQPDDFPKQVRKEIGKAFDLRLNNKSRSKRTSHAALLH